jgi:2-polyprenyl-3-methyl-5-hydroxy-6-metoxy-1,4-benzoquinol methylase
MASAAEIERQSQSYSKGFNQTLARWRVRSLRVHCRGKSCLDVGCGEGDITLALTDLFERVVGLDLTEEYLAVFRSRIAHPHVSARTGSIEDFPAAERFDTIIAVDILEHVEDVPAVLGRLRALLAPGGRLLVVVPNAGSLHRRLGKAMGLIRTLDELGEQDHRVGHRRYYDFGTLRVALESAGFAVASMEGILLKPLPNNQLENVPQPYLDALYDVGRELPDYCAEILAVATPPPG